MRTNRANLLAGFGLLVQQTHAFRVHGRIDHKALFKRASVFGSSTLTDDS